jgi:hypothetical protein
MRRECRAAGANTAQLVPSSLNFHQFFALLSVPLTGCTGALMRFSCHPSEKLFHARATIFNARPPAALGCSVEIAWEVKQMFSEDRQVTNFLIRHFMAPPRGNGGREQPFNALN